jgi:putative transposase
MPWKETRTMDLRVQVIREYNEGESISALGDIYGVSRKTIYKWIERHQVEGMAGLADRRRTPLHSPGKVSEEMVAHIITARERWRWGGRASLDGLAGREHDWRSIEARRSHPRT